MEADYKRDSTDIDYEEADFERGIKVDYLIE